VEVYVRPAGDEPKIHSVDYFYERQDGQWKFTGTDASASSEKHVEGLERFKKLYIRCAHKKTTGVI
jgi:hypothetical protein